MVLKDDFSATAVVAYFLSLNIFTIIGYYRVLFQQSSLSELPLFYAIIIMLIAGIFTHFVLLNKKRRQAYADEFVQSHVVKGKKGTWATVIYMAGSFGLMLSII